MKIRLKQCVRLISEKENFSESSGIYIGLENIESWSGLIKLSENPSVEGAVTRFNRNDILFGKLRPYLAKVIKTETSGVCSTEALVLRPKSDFDPQYLRYRLCSSDFISRVTAGTFGAKMPRASWQNIGNEEIEHYSLTDQKHIVDFLDKETARINLLIEKKKQLQSLLIAKYLAPFDQFYVKAETVRFERVADQVYRQINQSLGDEVIPVGLLNRGRGIFSKHKTQIHELGDSDFFYVEQGDLVFSGQFAWEGAVALVGATHHRCVASHRYPIFASKPGIRNAYLFALFRTRHGNFILNDCSRGAAGRNRPLNVNRLRKWEIPIPSEVAQREIEDMVVFEQESNKQIQLSIEKLAKYRTALITAAVTGQIDVKSYGKSGAVDRHLDQFQEEGRA